MKRLFAWTLGMPLSLFVLAGAAAGPCLAQTSVAGSINGIITDPSSAVIPDVNVTVTNTGTQQAVKAVTNASGYYTVPNLVSGDYDVRAEKEGFQACLNRGVHLDPAASVEISCALKVGQVSQTVEVQATAVNVDVSDTKVQRTVDSTQMEQLPVNGRNFVSLLGLQPGVVQSFSFNSFQAMSLFASQCTQVNGLTGESNNLLIDGAPSTRTRANGATVGMPGMDSISEVNIITTGYMPEYSRAAGGQMVVNLKSGTDQYHGDAFEFVRNDALDARYFFSSSRPKLDYNDFGFTFGGPVIPNKHKLYFFWSEEWQREVSGNTEVGQVPTMEDRIGDLAPYCQAFASSCPKVPSYLNGVDGLVAGQAFPNNTIPTALLSPNGSAMVSHFYLMPNTVTNKSSLDPYEGGNNLIYNYNSPTDVRIDDVKGDYNINDKNHLAVTLRHYADVSTSPTGSGGASALLDQGYHFPSRGATVDFTTTFSPTLLNDFTVTATEDIVHVLVPGGSFGGNGVDRTSLGVDYPYIVPGGAASKDIAQKIPTLIISGNFEQVSGLPYPSGSTGHVYTLQDVVTNIRGNHTVKTGFWFEHDGENDHDQVRVSPGGGVGNNLNGQFEFNASGINTTGAGLADALLGNFDNYSELGWRDYTPWYGHQVGVFGQDSWKVTPRLTVQGGLRWDYFEPYQSTWCNFAMFDPAFYSFTAGTQQLVNPTTGFVTGGNPYNGIATPCQQLPQSAAGHFAVLGQQLTTSNLAAVNQELRNLGMQRGLSNQILGSRWDDFQPRFGFAWDPKGDGKTSVRAGGGVFYNHNTLSDVTLMGGNTPFQLAEETFNGRADCPGDAFPGAAGCSAPTTPPNLPIPITGQDLVNKTPVVYSWNFTVQHEFWNDTLVDVGYVGNRGKHFPINGDLNQPAIGTFNNPANSAINQDVLRPYPGIGGAMTDLQEASSKYDALQVSIQRRFTNNLQYSVAYTYSKCFDMADSIYSVVADTYDPKFNWEVCGFNQTHNLTATYIYNLPFFKNDTSLLGKTLGGWEVSGDVAFVSGFDNTVSASSDYLGNGAQGIGATLPAYVKAGCNTRGNRTIAQFFNTSCFYEPPLSGPGNNGLVGSSAYNTIEGPGVDNFDFALIKNGAIWGEKVHYQFRGEFFNFFNHPSFNGIDVGVSDGAFGQVNSAVTQRNIQLGLKIIF
ncbi:MAG TPA: carboxypeptidase regulatory-like domain-containing protein [Terriglobia bacterium]|nr:carboxypeptidase regulatory-like domain-containing protein [Terriglobia bacterium]